MIQFLIHNVLEKNLNKNTNNTNKQKLHIVCMKPKINFKEDITILLINFKIFNLFMF